METEEHEVRSLRRGLRDLVALTTLPAIWAGVQPHNIAKSLSEVLLTTLDLDLVYIYLKRFSDSVPQELVKTTQGLIVGTEAQKIGKSLAPVLKINLENPLLSIPDPLLETGTMQIAVVPIGYEAIDGFIMAGVRSANPITELDRLLIGVAANQAVTALQQAQLVIDLRIANQLKSNLLIKEQSARREAEVAQRQMRFLAEASATLAANLDYETTLMHVVDLAVPTIADWCTVYLFTENGNVQIVRTAAKTFPMYQILMEIQKQILFDVNSLLGTEHVLRTGKSLFIPEIDTLLLKGYTKNAALVDLMKQLNPQSAIVVALQAREQILGAISLNLSEADHRYDFNDLALAEELAHRIATAIDRARLYKAEQTAREALQVRVQLQALIAELGQQALISYDLPTLMNKATVLLAQTLGVEYTNILELHSDENRLLLKAGVGWKVGLVGHAYVSAGLESQAGYTLASSHPIIVEDLRTESRFNGPTLLREHGVISSMSVIIQGHEGPWGVLSVHTTQQRTFTPDDIYFLQSATNVLGAALERARWYEQAQETATLKERQRIVRELHDAVSQTLFAANLMAETLPRLWEQNPEKALERTHQLHQLTRGTAAEMRVLLIELRPESVINANLADLLTQLGYAMPGRKNIDVSVIVRGKNEPPLPPDVQMAFYRVAQESLNNIIKHGQAKQARIRLIRTKMQTSLIVTDNGSGFDLGTSSRGIGLQSMWERARSIGALFDIKSKLGRGSQVRLTWTVPGESRVSV